MIVWRRKGICAWLRLLRRLLRIVDSAFQLIDDDLIFFEVWMVIACVADAVVLVGGEVGAELVHFLEGEFLSDFYFTLFFSPLLIIKLNDAQILKLQLLLFTTTTGLFFAMSFIIWIKIVLLILCK